MHSIQEAKPDITDVLESIFGAEASSQGTGWMTEVFKVLDKFGVSVVYM